MTQQTVEQPFIRAAEMRDVNRIYNLLIDGFGNRYLPYTIFQPPQSVAYLKHLIEQGITQTGHRLFVSVLADGLSGFYDAVLHRTDFFLNYIVVAQAERGYGVGQALLAHFEAKGRSVGCQNYVLDVFESNSRACQWYLNQGYVVVSSSYQVRLLTANRLMAKTEALLVAPDDLQRAIAEEQAQGFSKVEGTCSIGRITIGLIGGQVCKLLGYGEQSLDEAVASICLRFGPDRTVLIVPSLSELPTAWPLLGYEKTLRLAKASS